MKKLFAFLAVVAILTACNDSAESKETKDSTTFNTTVSPANESISAEADSISRAADSVRRADSIRN